jgi:putative oxidoreductase
MKDAGLLAVRAVGGALLAGHGAQKLFGAFEGPGLRGTATGMEMLVVLHD